MYKLICKHPINISYSPMSQLKVGFLFYPISSQFLFTNLWTPITRVSKCAYFKILSLYVHVSWKAQEDKKLSKSRFLNNFWRYDVKDESSKEENETKSKFLKFFTLPNYVDSNIHFFLKLCTLFKLHTFHQWILFCHLTYCL